MGEGLHGGSWAEAGAAFFYPKDVHGVLTELVPYQQPGVRLHRPG